MPKWRGFSGDRSTEEFSAGHPDRKKWHELIKYLKTHIYGFPMRWTRTEKLGTLQPTLKLFQNPNGYIINEGFSMKYNWLCFMKVYILWFAHKCLYVKYGFLCNVYFANPISPLIISLYSAFELAPCYLSWFVFSLFVARLVIFFNNLYAIKHV